MVEIAINGRTLKRGDPVRDAILAQQRDCKANGVPYPCRTVEDFYAVPFVWLGRVPYRADTLERLALTQEARKRPILLPDHFVVNGDKRLPGENAAQHAKFLAYRDFGPERSLNKLAKSLGRKEYRNKAGKPAANSGYYSALASRFRWSERSAAWDAQIEIEARRTQQAIMQDQLREEVERRQTYLDNEWAVVEKGFAVVHEMLEYPVVEKKSERIDEQGMTHITVWHPGKWTYSAMAQLIEALTKIGRLHSGLSTSNTSQKTEDLTDGSGKRDAPLNPDEEAMHRVASQRAETEYFRAIDEWKARKHPDRIVAHVDAYG